MDAQLEIISDGTVRGTKVVVVSTGGELRNVLAISWRLSAEPDVIMPVATVVLRPVKITIIAPFKIEEET